LPFGSSIWAEGLALVEKFKNPEGVYFKRQIDAPMTKCKNSEKASFKAVCDYYVPNGFTICEGCKGMITGKRKNEDHISVCS